MMLCPLAALPGAKPVPTFAEGFLFAALPGAKPVPTFAKGRCIMIGERCTDFVKD